MDNIPYQTVKSISFGVYTTEEIKKLSVLEITNVEILDCLGHPSPGGLYDLHLGPNEKDDFCATCGLNFFKCPGHPGHISLPVSVYNPVFFPQLYQILRGSCFYCFRLMAPPVALHLTLYQLQALDYGLVSTVQDLAEVVTDTSNEVIAGKDVVTIIQLKLKRKFDDAIAGLSVLDKKSRVKSVVECRRNIVKSFVRNHMMNVTGKCPHCKMPRKKLSRHNMRIVFVESQKSVPIKESSNVGNEPNESNNDAALSNKELTPEEAKKHLHLLWKNDKVFLQHLYKTLYCEEKYEELSIDMFFMNAMIVPPSKFRRLNVMKGRKYADAQTVVLNEVVKDCNLMRNLLKVIKQLTIDDSEKDIVNKLPGKTHGEKFNFVYRQLQRHVNEIYDSDTNRDKNKVSKGIKQILEKKEGLFRMNMMGKRVNYAARSVISPDPYIMVNEIGVPLVFAKKLTFPEPVSHWNAERLRMAVKNGPDIHPGASLVEYEDGKIVKLSAQDPGKRQAIANTLLTPQTSGPKYTGGVKIVHRHLRNGDMLLLNRQPTLHKPSIMAHKARVLPGEKTLRLHYANCKSYNADFDGDEMNAHFPQSFIGQAESRGLVSVNHQYLVPKDGTPLSGLIQDHIIAGTLLTMRGRFFSKEDYHQLVYSAASFTPKRFKLLPPSILKPEVLWSGKQIVSTIIINLVPDGKQPPTLEGKAKVSSKNWKSGVPCEWKAGGTPLCGDSMSESEVIIRSGELLCGVIDKAQIGPTPYSLIHICYELYGGETSSIILTALARLFTHYLQYHTGFTLGIEDIVVTKKANKKRRKILRKANKRGLMASAQALDVDNPSSPDTEDLLFKFKETHFSRDDFGLKMLDVEMKKVTHALNNEINEVCIPNGLVKKFPVNNLQLMVESGAKGSSVNAMQISCLLGQIELEGRRMPLMLNGSTLPSFLAYDTSPEAGGFVGGRFLTGINPREYFFHCMAGREGLIDTAVKTSRSGYLQRCLIKHLEGISVNYDMTVRDSDGTIIQFLYGEDGLNILKLQMLKENRLHLLAQNYNSAINESEVETLLKIREEDPEKLKKKINKWKKKHPEGRVRSSVVEKVLTGNSDLNTRLLEISSQKSEMDETYLKHYKRKRSKCPDPVTSIFRPDTVFGSISEKLDEVISNYMKKNPHKLIMENEYQRNAISASQFQTLCYYHTLKSLAEPGETVGLLAAQSIGEPSTQMTLNTFHFAGKGEMNVTLGIPRIREILMTASPNIATPTMDLPLLDKPGIEDSAEKLRLKLCPVLLKDVLEGIKIKEYLCVSQKDLKQQENSRNYKIKFNFLKYSEYKGYVNVSPSKILYYMEHVFVKKLVEAIKKKMHLSSTSKLIDVVKENYNPVNKSEPTEEDIPVSNEAPAANEDESSGESDGDGDTTSAKSKMRHEQDQEYEDPEDEELIPETDEESVADEEITIKEEIRSSDEEQNVDFNAPKKFKSYHKNSVSDEDKAFRINAVKCVHSWIFDYNFDEQSERWCEISFQILLSSYKIDMKTLLEEEVSKALVYSVPQIKQAILVKNPDAKEGCKMMLKTNGVNFLEVFKYVEILDINKIYSNNIHAIADIYGVEAAANAIRKEIVNVFTPYGIQVDPRHLSLIADYMTSSGYYRPCNRIGMEGNASPLQQMTFETTKNFMVEAMLMGLDDKLKSPSANIIAGQLYGGGTGCFQICGKSG